MISQPKFLSELQGAVSGKILSPIVFLSMEKTMVSNVISELKSISGQKVFEYMPLYLFRVQTLCVAASW